MGAIGTVKESSQILAKPTFSEADADADADAASPGSEYFCLNPAWTKKLRLTLKLKLKRSNSLKLF